MELSMDKAIRLIKGITENTISVDEIKELSESAATLCDYTEYMMIQNFVYNLSYYFLDEEAFNEIADYIIDKGVSYIFFENFRSKNFSFYCLRLYYEGNKKARRLAIDQFDNQEFFYWKSPLYLITFMLTGDKRFYKKLKDIPYFNCELVYYQTDHDYNIFIKTIGDFFLYAAKNKITKLMDKLVVLKNLILVDYLSALAIEHTDIFYGFFSKYHKDFLSERYFDREGKILPLKMLIPALLYDPEWNEKIEKNITNIGILCKLCEIIPVSCIGKVADFIPEIDVITCYDFSCMRCLVAAKGLEDIIVKRAGEKLLLKNAFTYGIDNINWLSDFFKIFKNCNIYLEFEESYDHLGFANDYLAYNEKDTYRLLRLLTKNNVRPVSKNKEQYIRLDFIIPMDSQRVITEAVKAGIINKNNFDDALEMALSQRSLKSLNALNSMYDTAQSKMPHRIALNTETRNKRSYYYEVK